mgnify:CR=1 FL=1
MKVKKNYKLYLVLLLLILVHQFYFIQTPSNHGCGSDLPINFLYEPGKFNNSFSGSTYPQNMESYSGLFIKVDCDIGGVIVHTGSPRNYLLLEGSNSIERPLHHISAIPLRYISTGILRVLNIPIENTIINVYLSKGKVFEQQFYLSWYYAHILQNFIIIFISFFIFNKLVSPSLIKTFIFYLLFYLPVLGKEVVSPDMSLWIPVSILLNFVILENFDNKDKRIKIFWLTSFSILLYPIFVINFLFIGFLLLKSIYDKKLKFSETIKEGVILLVPYISYRIFLFVSGINFQPATWSYLGKNIECQSYCQGVWMFVEANTRNGILTELIKRINSGINSGQFVAFVIILVFSIGLFILNQRRNNNTANQSELILLLIAIVMFLIFVGNFLDRYVNYLPSILLINELRKLDN